MNRACLPVLVAASASCGHTTGGGSRPGDAMQLQRIDGGWFPLVPDGRFYTAAQGDRLRVFVRKMNSVVHDVSLGPDGRVIGTPAPLALRWVNAAVACGGDVVLAGDADGKPVVWTAGAAPAAAPWSAHLFGVTLVCVRGQVEAIWRDRAAPTTVWWSRLASGRAMPAITTADFAALDVTADDGGVVLAVRDQGRTELVRLADGAPVARAQVPDARSTGVRVVATPAGIIVTWLGDDGHGVWWHWFSADLRPVGGPQQIVAAGDRRSDASAIVSAGDRAALIYNRVELVGETEDSPDGTLQPIERRQPVVALVDLARRAIAPAALPALAPPLVAAAWLNDRLLLIHGGGPARGAATAPRISVITAPGP
jgi:hypothetical protein